MTNDLTILPSSGFWNLLYKASAILLFALMVVAVDGDGAGRTAWAEEEAAAAAGAGRGGGAGREIVARINGIEVSRTVFELAESELGTELAGLPPGERHALILDYLVETLLMAEAARKSGLTEDEKFRQRVEYYRRRALRDMYFEKNVRDAITDEDVRVIYDQQIGRSKPIDEVRVRHILLETREEAEKILEQLKQGRDFGTLAQAHSLGPSKVQGGDLGYFSRGQMVKEFEDAAFALEKGKVSDPVKTQFGWHILLVEDRRSSEVPPFEAVKDRIRAPLIQQRAQRIIQALKKDAKVEILDAKLAKAIRKTAPAGQGDAE